jgi:hypothetical protein
MAAELDEDDKEMLYRLCKSGMTLTQISTNMRVTDDTVLEVLAQRIGITSRKMFTILNLREQHSLQKVSELTLVPVSSLLEILPESNLPADLQNQILTLYRQGQTPDEISHSTGFTVDQVIMVVNSIKLESRGPGTTSTLVEERPFRVSDIIPKRDEERRPVPSAVQRGPEDAKQETKTLPNGDSYRGQLLNDKPHGRGTMQYAGANVRSYDGDWVNGVREGQGKVTWPNGTVFEGNWANDQKNGQGTLTEESGQVYVGAWRNDRKHGQGVVTWPNGEKYDGQWKDDVIEGQGTYTFDTREVYRGSFEDYLRHGEGVQTMPDGGRYEGTWKEGKMHGEFTYVNERTSRRERWVEGALA